MKSMTRRAAALSFAACAVAACGSSSDSTTESAPFHAVWRPRTMRPSRAEKPHYVGEGAYAGLEFHYYFFHADLGDDAEIRGWISAGA